MKLTEIKSYIADMKTDLDGDALDSLPDGMINEAGLARVLSMTEKPFAILTAFRGDNTLAQNRTLNRQLLGQLNAKKMGPYRLLGHWQEAPEDMEYEKAKEMGLTKDTKEDSFFIPMPADMDYEKFEDEILALVKKYKQDAAVIGDGEKFSLLFKKGNKIKVGSKVSIGKINQAFSQLRNKKDLPFVFEGTIHPINHISKHLFEKLGIRWVQ